MFELIILDCTFNAFHISDRYLKELKFVLANLCQLWNWTNTLLGSLDPNHIKISTACFDIFDVQDESYVSFLNDLFYVHLPHVSSTKEW